MTLDFERLKALEARATKGPWHFSPGDYEVGSDGEREQYEEAQVPEIFTIDRGEYYGLGNENGAFIVEMRNTLPGLIATIEQYEAALRAICSMDRTPEGLEPDPQITMERMVYCASEALGDRR